jgi:hypothetical protein
MTEIVVTDEQASVLRHAVDRVVLRSAAGDVVGIVAPLLVIRTPEDEEAFVRKSLALAAASPKPRTGVSTQELLDRLARMVPPQ